MAECQNWCVVTRTPDGAGAGYAVWGPYPTERDGIRCAERLLTTTGLVGTVIGMDQLILFDRPEYPGGPAPARSTGAPRVSDPTSWTRSAADMAQPPERAGWLANNEVTDVFPKIEGPGLT